MYRYTISTNTWTTLGLSRAGSAGAGSSLAYFFKTGDSVWANESAIIDGRRLYSFRGSGGSALDYFDIPSSTWVQVSYAPGVDTFTVGTSSAYDDAYIYMQKESTGRWFRFDPVLSAMEPWGGTTYTQSTSAAGNRAWIIDYIDGATTIKYVYFWLNGTNVVLRQLVI
jgi:hypothetical protein